MSSQRIYPLEKLLIKRMPPSSWSGMRLVLAVSGGADSVALACAMHRLRPRDSRLILAHFNHQLRGQESDEDGRFVERLAQSLDCEFITNTPNPLPPQPNSDPKLPSYRTSPRDEATLRTMRYGFLESVCRSQGARFLATAHTADDQVETILLQFFRGTGLAGLRGIQAYRPATQTPDLVLVRPLLDATRTQVLEYLHSLQQGFRSDSSNLLTDYTRNWIRLELLPSLENRLGPHTRSAILSASQHHQELYDWLESQAAQTLAQIDHHLETDRFTLAWEDWQSLAWPLQHAILRSLWSQLHWPLQNMNREAWLLIREIGHVSSPTSAAPFPPPPDFVLPEMLPGGIRVSLQSGLLQFHRVLTPEKTTG